MILIEETRSSIVNLPHNGALVVGASVDADLRLHDNAVSRKHARILLSDDEARIVDLDSRNGTKVNGERIEGSRSIEPGDTISIGEVTLILRCVRRAKTGGRPLLTVAELRQRMDEEIDRAARYGRSLSAAVVATSGSFVDAPEMNSSVAAAVQPDGLAASAGASQVIALIPELDGDAVETRLKNLLADWGGKAGQPRIGIASFPDDGCDADTLIASARLAAARATPGGTQKARDIPSVLAVGDRSIIVADPAVSRLFVLIERLAASDLPVLISGETGAGKENAAYAVHAWSPRAKNPFVVLNCAALQETLIESELFGHEKGAFTGAIASKPGLLETASGGTVFLDEVGDLSPGGQAKLLRVIESKRLTRLGEVREREIDIRLVCATHRDLEVEVTSGRFRRDLYFRLSAGTVSLPPLRDRSRELPLLADRFLDAACTKSGRARLVIAPATMKALAAYTWPGNVRELKNVMEYAAAVVDDDQLQVWHLPEKIVGTADETSAAIACGVGIVTKVGPPAASEAAQYAGFRPLADELRELEKRRMREALQASGGVQRHAAELIGMPIRTFAMKFKQYGFRASEN